MKGDRGDRDVAYWRKGAASISSFVGTRLEARVRTRANACAWPRRGAVACGRSRRGRARAEGFMVVVDMLNGGWRGRAVRSARGRVGAVWLWAAFRGSAMMVCRAWIGTRVLSSGSPIFCAALVNLPTQRLDVCLCMEFSSFSSGLSFGLIWRKTEFDFLLLIHSPFLLFKLSAKHLRCYKHPNQNYRNCFAQ